MSSILCKKCRGELKGHEKEIGVCTFCIKRKITPMKIKKPVYGSRHYDRPDISD